MPSHTAASALIKLYSLNGSPWQWSAWKDLTGIRHGLFPPDDAKLPAGISRAQAIDIESYFRTYISLSTEDEKIQFATRSKGNASYPGRAFWNDFVAKHWSRWGIHTLIVKELKEADIHPQDILIRENPSVWPVADNYVAIILDSLGMKLFGEEAFPNGTEVLPSEIRLCLKIIVQRSWATIRSHVSNLKTRAGTIESQAREAFAELERGKPTKAKLNKTIRAVAKWKECAEVLHTPENVQLAEMMLSQLEEVMRSLGAKIVSRRAPTTKGLSKVSTMALQNLASQEDVSDILNVYHEYFDVNSEDEDGPPIPETLTPHREVVDCDGDLGTEIQSMMSLDTLCRSLGFKTGLPPSFNRHRHRSGISPWDDSKIFSVEDQGTLPEYLDEMKLHWHQLAGVHSIIRSVFTETEGGIKTPGMLIADEVGLGKTAQSITVLAFLNQVLYLQSQKMNLPPILENRPFFLGKREVPSHPHLILCPGTLVMQWVSELKTWFMPRSVDVLVYDSQTEVSTFWSPSGPLYSSKHLPHHRIIVATHSTIFNEFRRSHRKPPRRKNSRPWVIPDANKQITGSIFEQSFLTVIIDEAHHMRNTGNNHLAALRLLQQAQLRLVMTATPLHTAPKDIASLGRLTGVPHFSNETSFIEEKNDASNLRKAKRQDDNGEALIMEQLKIVRRLQGHCLGHILRRTTESKDWEGNVLLPLPPYREIIGLVNLTGRELTIMEERAEAAKALLLGSSNARIQTKKFYLEYRLAVGYAKEEAASLWPTFKSLDEWEPLKSTKMDICAKICAHYLKHDRVEDIIFEGGQVFFPPTVDDKELPRQRRIIIYAEFPSMAPLLQDVLRLYGVESLAINGKIPFWQRDKCIKIFYDNKDPTRVLVFSSIGSTGLNLSIADVVIFFDQPWSAQDERQIRGRIHRQPQKKEVRSIHILAKESSDPIMYEVARGKRHMFDAFVNKELGEELRSLLQGGIPDQVDVNGNYSLTQPTQPPQPPQPPQRPQPPRPQPPQISLPPQPRPHENSGTRLHGPKPAVTDMDGHPSPLVGLNATSRNQIQSDGWPSSSATTPTLSPYPDFTSESEGSIGADVIALPGPVHPGIDTLEVVEAHGAGDVQPLDEHHPRKKARLESMIMETRADRANIDTKNPLSEIQRFFPSNRKPSNPSPHFTSIEDALPEAESSPHPENPPPSRTKPNPNPFAPKLSSVTPRNMPQPLASTSITTASIPGTLTSQFFKASSLHSRASQTGQHVAPPSSTTSSQARVPPKSALTGIRTSKKTKPS